MSKPFLEWTVLPHGKLTRLDDNLFTVAGVLRMPPMGDVERRMTVVRLSDGHLIVYSAIALDETEMSRLETIGTPAYLVVPSDLHRMDAKAWKDRYPAIKVITPAGARAKVEKVVPVAATTVSFGDPAVSFAPLPGTDEREAALLVKTHRGTTLVLNDIIFNLPNRPGFLGWLFKTIGMTGSEPRLPFPVRMRQVRDKHALRAQLELWSKLPNLKRIIISHGAVISNDPARALARVAEQLAA